jgi:hypothetical protein
MILIIALAVALTLTSISIAPDVRARWFADPEPVQLLIVAIDNARETRPVDMIIRVPGEEPWRPVFPVDAPADFRFLGFYPVGEKHTFTVEILGERGVTFVVEFEMTSDMQPVDTRNRIEIDVWDGEVIVRRGPGFLDEETINR